MRLWICGGFIAAIVVMASATAQAVPVNLLLSSNGGVADINGASGPGSGGFGTVASNLNDGNPDGAYGDGSIGHSATEFIVSTMGVTIPAPTSIGSVVLYNRTDCCDARIDNFGTQPYTLTILNGATTVFTQNYAFVADITAVNVLGQTITLPSPVTGDRVQITQNFVEWMNIAEIAAFAPVPEPASLVLLGLGAVGLIAVARRSRRTVG